MSWPSGRHECEASSRVKTSRPIEARRHQMAVARRGGRSNVAGCRQHSDRGSQFGSRRIWRRWGAKGLVGSMGRVGTAGGNAAMESLFALLQKNVTARPASAGSRPSSSK